MIAEESAGAVPAAVRAAALAAFRVVDRQTQVLDLDEDDVHVLEGRSFCAEGVQVRVHLEAQRMQVRVEPAPDGAVVLEAPGAVGRPLERDGDVHLLGPLPSGPVSLLLTVGGRRYRTAWTTF